MFERCRSRYEEMCLFLGFSVERLKVRALFVRIRQLQTDNRDFHKSTWFGFQDVNTE